MNLDAWASRWNLPAAAVADLRLLLLIHNDVPAPPPDAAARSEAFAQSQVRLEATKLGMRLWRNNVGAFTDDRGAFIRFGLANDSPAVNKRLKSADLVGIKPVTITASHVGHTIGQFVSREVKRPGWKYRGDERETAQLAWANLILSLGGDAGFATGTGSFQK